MLLAAVLAGAMPAFAFSFKAPSSFPKPTATLTRFAVSAITLRDVTFLFELTVDNPYPVPLSFRGMDLAFSVEGTQVFKVESQGGFKVPARGAKANTFTVTLVYENIIKVVKDYVSKDLLNTVIDGTLVIPLPNLPGVPSTISFSYSLKQQIPAIKPKVTVTDFSVLPPTQAQVRDAIVKKGLKDDPGKALGALKNVLQGKKPAAEVIDPSELDVPVSVSFTIELANDSKASLTFARLAYDFDLNGERLVSGDTTQIRREGSRTLLVVQSVFSSKQLSEGVRRIFSEHSGRFRVSGKTDIKLPDEIRVEPVPLAFDEEGSFKF